MPAGNWEAQCITECRPNASGQHRQHFCSFFFLQLCVFDKHNYSLIYFIIVILATVQTVHHWCQTWHFRCVTSETRISLHQSGFFLFLPLKSALHQTIQYWIMFPLQSSCTLLVVQVLLSQLVTTVRARHWRRIECHDYCSKHALGCSIA